MSVLCEIATQQIALGSIGAALATAAEIKDVRSKVSTLCEIAAAQSKAGQSKEAVQSFHEAFIAARQDCWCMVDVARAQAKAGLVQQAESSFNEVLIAARKLAGSQAVSAFCWIAVSQTQAGLKEQGRRTFAEAFAAARQSGDADQFRYVATSQDEAGLFVEALATARAMKDSIQRVDVLCNLAAAQTNRAKLEQARESLHEAMTAARGIENDAEKQRALYVIGTCTAQPVRNADFFAEPLGMARKIEDAWEKADMLRALAAAQATAGLKEQARQTFGESLAAARQINDNEPAESDSSDDAGLRTAAAISNITAAEVQAGLLPEALCGATDRRPAHEGQLPLRDRRSLGRTPLSSSAYYGTILPARPRTRLGSALRWRTRR